MLVSPDLIQAAGWNLILGDEIKVHAKGMKKAIKCSELLGHEDHPELRLHEGEQTFTTLPEPLPVHYLLLTNKHFDEQMQPATLVGLSHRRAVLEASGPLSPYANIPLRLEAEAGDEREREIYAKVIRNVEESSKRYIIHFTSLPPGMRARLDRLTKTV